jgi:light-independent protochlorophyllide reductase subunit B
MGLEEHLLHMFRDDFEFHDDAGASHHGAAFTARVDTPAEVAPDLPQAMPLGQFIWLSDAENELKKIPFFVRGKARRNTEKYAEDKGVTAISIETLYEAKAHYAR